MVNKKLLSFLLVLLILPIGFAQFGEDTKGTNNSEYVAKAPVVQRSIDQVKEQIQERKQLMEQELANKSTKEQNVYRKQNRVREAVHALIALRNSGQISGGIGQNVSRIANEFNNSVNKTIQAETKLQKRGGVMKMLFGANDEEVEAAEEIETEVTQNQQRIQKLKKLKEECNCSEETKQLIQEQIENMEQEQNRLEDVAKNGKSKGLLGWLFN